MKTLRKMMMASGIWMVIMAYPVGALAAGGPRLSLGGIVGLTGARDGSSNPAQSTDFSSSRKFSFGAGALIEAPLVDSFGIELGTLYVARKFELGGSSLKMVRTVPTLFVPLEGRFWIGNVLSVAAGAFGAIRVGSETDEITSGSTSFGSYSSGQRENPEYGMTLAAAVNFAVMDKTGVFVEARYNRGFTNSSKDGLFEERIDDFLLMAGVRLDLLGK